MFLLIRWKLINFLLILEKEIKKFFPKEKLQLSIEPERGYPNWKKLILSICAKDSNPDEIYNNIKLFDSWYLDAVGDRYKKLIVMIEFDV